MEKLAARPQTNEAALPIRAPTHTPSEETLRGHKREAFDAMRAYHQSEISHTYHAITMMVAIAGVTSAAVFAVVVAKTPPKHAVAFAWGLFGAVSLLMLAIALTVHLKIGRDHDRHERSAEEWNNAAELLGLFELVTIDGEARFRHRGNGVGHRETRLIIWAFGLTVSFLALLVAIVVTLS
jgi:hypothetical protein